MSDSSTVGQQAGCWLQVVAGDLLPVLTPFVPEVWQLVVEMKACSDAAEEVVQHYELVRCVSIPVRQTESE